MERIGIAVAGNMIVDKILSVDRYPQPQHLAHIHKIEYSLGGAVNNLCLGLARIDPNLPLQAIGHVGEDPEGQLVLDTLKRQPSIDLSQVGRSGVTAFTDVMADQQTLQRTFFTYSGADALLGRGDFDFSRITARILHIAYILLLPGLDAADAEYGTVMARVLHGARQAGIETSVDIVSEENGRYADLVPAALRHTDYCVINEHEAAETTGIRLRGDDGSLFEAHVLPALRAMRHMGVARWACIHCPEAGFGLDEQQNFWRVPSLALPAGYIQGTVGAGDAFCAGVLYGAHAGWSLEKSLQFAAGSAAASLSHPGATEGMRPAEQIWKLIAQYRAG